LSSADDDPAGVDRQVRPFSPAVSPAQMIDLERSQIGHDLHDLLLPLIFAASANLQTVIDSADPSSDRVSIQPASIDTASLERLRQSGRWLQEALQCGRNLLTQIYPPELDRLPWLVAAKDVAERICGPDCEIMWKVDESSPVCDPNWDRDVAGCAYRILVESLRNAIRHGKAEAVSIRCQSDGLLIVDDGKGFVPDAVEPSRFGIRSMKGRAALVGKTLTVESQPGGPTTVRLNW
jgi:signal transduction histidine kinase